MRKFLLICVTSTLVLSIAACSLINQNQSFENKAGTQVAIALTATALDATVSAINNPTTEPAATVEPSRAATEGPQSDPKADLGSPSYIDNCSSWSAWSVESEDQVLEDITTISVADGMLSMQSSKPGKFHWWLNYRELADGYIEAKFVTGNCSGSDQYGLVFRAPDYFNGVGYYLTLTCDGKFDLREKDDPNALIENNQLRFGMQENAWINSGPDQSNTIGLWMQDETIRIYINDHFVDEITDAEVTEAGHFGPFIYTQNTPGFKISLDQVSYWLFD